MRFSTFFAAVLAIGLLTAAPSSAQTARPYDLQQLNPDVRAAVESARAAQTRALRAAARAQAAGTAGHTRFTGGGGDSYNGECNPCSGNLQRHGAGLLSWPDGEIYAGEHMRGDNGGAKHGFGVYMFVNGAIFEGQYNRDQFNGYGAIWDATGQLIEQGWYANGQLAR